METPVTKTLFLPAAPLIVCVATNEDTYQRLFANADSRLFAATGYILFSHSHCGLLADTYHILFADNDHSVFADTYKKFSPDNN